VSSALDASLTGLAALVGRTPLLRLRRFEPRPGVEVYAKLESRNPGGSVKDRAALAMILEGERTGALHPGKILMDATSGNTGIAYAMLGAARGYHVRLCLPSNVTRERKQLLHAYGAELVFTDPMDGSDGAIREARRLFQVSPDQYFYPDQYSNPANWRAHFDGTANEIIEQTQGRITHFVAGLGTSGTFVGTGRRLREWRPSVQLISVQPESPLHGLEGLKHMESAIVPSIYDASLADRDARVSTEDAYRLVLQLAREEGILVGPSGGAALAASLLVAGEIERGIIVTVFPDGGDRYLSESFWANAPAPRDTDSVRRPAYLVRLGAGTDEAIRAHGVSTYPDECCGALLGPAAGDIVEAFALPNEHGGEKRRRFLIGPEEYRLAEKRAAETGRELLGFYHSHPDHPAVPSAFDLEHAWPNLSYIIVSVKNGRPDAMRSWRLKADRSGYDEEAIAQPADSQEK
jgi:cysteine synthase B